MTKPFTKDSMRKKHRAKIQEILDSGGGADEITNYLMIRIGTAISYERRKYERRIQRQWSNNDGKGKEIHT